MNDGMLDWNGRTGVTANHRRVEMVRLGPPGGGQYFEMHIGPVWTVGWVGKMERRAVHLVETP